MNIVMSALLLAGTMTVGLAAPAKPGAKKAAPQRSLEQQLSGYLTYPEVLRQANREGVVVVQFQVGDDSRLRKVAVLSQNEQLNASLIRQLTGKKLNLPNTTDETHTVRLRFQLD